MLTPYQIDGCKCFLPFCRLPFQVTDCFLCSAKAFQLNIVPLVYFSLCCLHIWCLIQGISAKTNVKELFPYVFFWELYGFRSYIEVFNPLQVSFCNCCKIRVQVSLFCMWISSFPNTIYGRDYPFPIVNSWCLCWKLTDLKCLGLFLSSPPCSTDPYVRFYTKIILLSLL